MRAQIMKHRLAEDMALLSSRRSNFGQPRMLIRLVILFCVANYILQWMRSSISIDWMAFFR
jgi:hypothetical protein